MDQIVIVFFQLSAHSYPRSHIVERVSFTAKMKNVDNNICASKKVYLSNYERNGVRRLGCGPFACNHQNRYRRSHWRESLFTTILYFVLRALYFVLCASYFELCVAR